VAADDAFINENKNFSLLMKNIPETEKKIIKKLIITETRTHHKTKTSLRPTAVCNY